MSRNRRVSVFNAEISLSTTTTTMLPETQNQTRPRRRREANSIGLDIRHPCSKAGEWDYQILQGCIKKVSSLSDRFVDVASPPVQSLNTGLCEMCILSGVNLWVKTWISSVKYRAEGGGKHASAAQQKSAIFHWLPDSEIYTTEYIPAIPDNPTLLL